MKRKIFFVLTLVLVLSISLAAQEAGAEEGLTKVPDATSLFLASIIVGAVAITVAAVFGAFAQSKAIRVASENIGRNPAAADFYSGKEQKECSLYGQRFGFIYTFTPAVIPLTRVTFRVFVG